MNHIIKQTKDGLALLGNVEIVPDFSKPVTFTDIRGRKTLTSFSTKVEHALYSIITQKEQKVFVHIEAEDLALSTLYKYAARYVVPSIDTVYAMSKAGKLMPTLDLGNTYISYRLNFTGIYIYTSPFKSNK